MTLLSLSLDIKANKLWSGEEAHPSKRFGNLLERWLFSVLEQDSIVTYNYRVGGVSKSKNPHNRSICPVWCKKILGATSEANIKTLFNPLARNEANEERVPFLQTNWRRGEALYFFGQTRADKNHEVKSESVKRTQKIWKRARCRGKKKRGENPNKEFGHLFFLVLAQLQKELFFMLGILCIFFLW